MKNFKDRTLFAVLLLTLGSLATAYAQNTPTDDAYTNTGAPTINYGTATTLSVVTPSETTYIKFDLSSIPTGYASANVAKASLKLYVNAVTTAGSLNVDFVNGTWSEKTITGNNAPALGTTVAPSVPLAKANAHDYILVDVTSAVGAWLDGSQANDGLALVGNSPLSASFDSKENTSQSHPPELDIVFNSTITGVTAGSGLSGGGTKGDVTLSLLNTCASGQALIWNGTAWECGNAGTGSITGVTAGTDLTGGGTGGNVTLNLNTAATDARYAQLVAANTFTGNQSIAGNVSANGTINATTGFNLGGSAFAFGSTSTTNAFLGFAGNSTMTGTGNTASGYAALHANTTGTYNTANGEGAIYSNTTGNGNTAVGFQALYDNATGSFNTALGSNAGTYPATNLSNTTAIGAFATVTASNSLVLGSTAPPTNVGIGTTAPQARLDVTGNGLEVYAGDPACGGGTAAIGFGSSGFSTCSNYALRGDSGGNLYINSSSTGWMFFNHNNSGLMSLDPSGNLSISGNLSKGGGSFKIDHPLDPANKYLYHSFVESPDMMNIYNGLVTLGARGSAWITMPDYLQALNRDFRYQLTSIGRPQPTSSYREGIVREPLQDRRRKAGRKGLMAGHGRAPGRLGQCAPHSGGGGKAHGRTWPLPASRAVGWNAIAEQRELVS